MAVNPASKLIVTAGFFFAASAACQVSATPALVIDAATGAVLHQEEATRPWYPASVTKLMTVYVALNAVRTGRITLQTPLRVSARAARAAPSKMGFKPGIEVTLENALKIIMVKSANDTSITIAEGIAGSVEAFASEMNDVARGLGMRESHFVNPNGLHNPAHVSSARDMAILARSLLRDFPQHSDLYGIGALQLGKRIIPTHNGLLGRYPGADGMKTGFVCASGFNVVATANRGGRKLIAVIMGAPNARARTLQAMALFDASFQLSGSGTAESLPYVGGSAPDMRPEICGRNRRNLQGEVPIPIAAPSANSYIAPEDSGAAAFFAADRNRAFGSGGAQGRVMANFNGVDLGPRPFFVPVPIYIGRAPGWNGRVAGPAVAEPDEDKAAESPRGKTIAAKPLILGVPATALAAGKAKGPKARPHVRETKAKGRNRHVEARGRAAQKAKPPVKARGKVAQAGVRKKR